jgi:hypothetical protein
MARRGLIVVAGDYAAQLRVAPGTPGKGARKPATNFTDLTNRY